MPVDILPLKNGDLVRACVRDGFAAATRAAEVSNGSSFGSATDDPGAYHAAMTHWTEIGDRVFVRRYAFFDQNIGVVLGGDEALVIDTRSTHVQAREIIDDLRELTATPVTVVVDTHGHFDHAFGNHVFRPATIWGHDGCGPFIERTGEAAGRGLPRRAGDRRRPGRGRHRPAGPDVLGDGVPGPRRAPVELRHLGRGHTDHDIVIGVPDAAVLFAGDLLENGAVPWFGDGYPLDWPETALRVAELAVGVVVPGHGDHGDRGVRGGPGGRDRGDRPSWPGASTPAS